MLRRKTIFYLKEAKEAVNALFSDIFDLDKNEEKFVEAFYGLDYRPDLIFPSNSILRYHPGAEWRLKFLPRKDSSS